jgi:hypothetical protein
LNLEKLSFGAALTVTALAVAGLVACERGSDGSPAPLEASPWALVIGTTLAAPMDEPPGMTPVTATQAN